ncbi:MAG: hydrogenase maturation protease [Phycisphaerae bacterium]|jgi:hydrogenase maturation protease
MLVQNGQDEQTATDRCPVLVLGLGNILLRDEGVGVRVIETLRERSRPEGVEFFDGATAGLDLLDVLADRRTVVVVDAIAGDYAPGTVLRLTPEDLLPSDHPGVSLHEMGILETLTVARHLGNAPHEVVIIGIKPFEVDYGLNLTDEMQRLMPDILALVSAELEKL